MKVSVIIRSRNEYPVILSTLHALQEDLEWSGLDHEFIVVDNCSNDDTADILEDRYRRWVRSGKLKVVRYNDKASTWVAINQGYDKSDGDVIIVCDAHITVKTGTLELISNQALNHGGIWHCPVSLWGDTRQKRYGYDLKLKDKFWGDPCPYLPIGAEDSKPWLIPMAGACLYTVTREEIQRFGLYDPAFRAYGGGEPYLAFKWWLGGSKVWLEPRGLCRHAFGWKAHWATAKQDKTTRNSVYKKDGKISKELSKGDEYIVYDAGYKVDNREYYYNFLLAAYFIGDHKWLSLLTDSFRDKFRDKNAVDKIAEEVIVNGLSGRKDIERISTRSFDDLLAESPWLQCNRHDHN